MIKEIYKRFLLSSGISTDTRRIRPGNLFFALKGPNFNANKLAAQALEQGASFAIVDDPAIVSDERFILVEDALKTLQKLANYHRKRLHIPILGITGSNGKTTTKELINLVLSAKYQVIATKGNLNNHIGVPLTLLEIKNDTEIAIVEMGANKIGDIAELCEIAEPSHGIISNIGKAHIEGFGGLEGVIRGKSELYQWLILHNGTVFMNSSDPILFNMAKRFKSPVLYPGKNDFFFVEMIEANPYIKCRLADGNSFSTQLIGKYNFINIAAALCIGSFFKVPVKEASEAISTYLPENNRSQIVKKGSITIILDAYNANPSSMEAALDNLSQMKAKNKVVILGDMFELGDESEMEHKKIGELVASHRFSKVIFCGERMEIAHKSCTGSIYFKDRIALEMSIKNDKFKDCLILVKGSRAMQLESIVEKINNYEKYT